jgi:serine/threonine protein phosphatase PrpC
MVVFSEPSDEHENEDAVRIEKLDDAWIGAIADGQGGRAGGAKASSLACESIMAAVRNSPSGFPVDPPFWRALFATADRAVHDDSEAGLTTLIAFCVKDGHVYGASCGDSAAYLCHARVYVNNLTLRQDKNPQIGSGITACTYFISPVVKPWSLLVMTDGVWKYVGWERINDILKRVGGEEFRSELTAAGRLPGSGKFPDDFSFALIEG